MVTKFTVVCKDTWTILGFIYAINMREAITRAKNIYHENVTVISETANITYDH